MIKFSSSTIPRNIGIDYFHTKLIAFYEFCDEGRLSYFYNGSIDEALGFLQSIGFADIEIIGEVPFDSGWFMLPRLQSDR
ncbi:hypothetical protein GS682_33015 [Nostoc sp. B(2019)]|nr:hypothetical protein [Nostoc sp. B(2019)]